MQHWNRYPERWQYLHSWRVSKLCWTKSRWPGWARGWITDLRRSPPTTTALIPWSTRASASLASPASLSWTRQPFGYQYCLLLLLSSQLVYSFPLLSRPLPFDTFLSVITYLFHWLSSPRVGKQIRSRLSAAVAPLNGSLEHDTYTVKLYLLASLVSRTTFYQSCSL